MKAAHPNAAKLWVNYLLSREGQDTLYQYDFQDAQQVPGSKTAPQLETLRASGIKLPTDAKKAPAPVLLRRVLPLPLSRIPPGVVLGDRA